ncbi:MAG: hypothetical protein HYZ85_01495 [Candidatus Omnitrophica bacterium]|nr:hypothetical protein [Candidatus Omnitrophota bacterium]
MSHSNEEERNNIDPLKSAMERGRIFGIGATGKYKKKPIVRIGFCILAIPLLAAGFRFSVIVFRAFPLQGAEESLATLWIGVLAAGSTLLALAFVVNAIRK